MFFKRLTATLAMTALFWTGVPSAHAIDVTPMIMQITPTGAASSYRLSIKNTEDQPVTVEIEVYRMQVDDDGRRTLTEEVDDLAIFPPQSVIPPNREQVVQVRYVGEPDVGARMYLVRVAQLPISFSSGEEEAKGAAVQVAFNVSTHVLLAPAGARPSLQVTSTRRAENGDVLITAENQGAGFARLREARYVLTTADGQAREVRAEDVVLGQVSSLPGGAKRNIRIPATLIPGLDSNVTATIELT